MNLVHIHVNLWTMDSIFEERKHFHSYSISLFFGNIPGIIVRDIVSHLCGECVRPDVFDVSYPE